MPKAITISHVEGKPGQVYYPLSLTQVPLPTPKDNEVLIRLTHAALNHRDLFIRQALYPGVTFDVPLLADGHGIVVSTGSASHAKAFQDKRVILCPGVGWESDPIAPEKKYAILGGTKATPVGTLQEYVCVPADEAEESPKHLSPAEAAALPLTGLTAWRALVTKSGNAEKGRNILVTGIGGGVALMALIFGVSKECNVYVSSGSQEKIDKAMELGAKGGVNYKEEKWEKTLTAMLPEGRKYVDAIIDGAGGNIGEKAAKLLKPGGVLVIYGLTTSPILPIPMSCILKNIDIRGTTMGSRAEFRAMLAFVRDSRLKPVVDRVVSPTAAAGKPGKRTSGDEEGEGGELEDLATLDALWDVMKSGRQFGKLVIAIWEGEKGQFAEGTAQQDIPQSQEGVVRGVGSKL